MSDIKDYIVVHGVISSIKENIDNRYIWIDITRNDYYKDEDGHVQNSPSFFSGRFIKEFKNKYPLILNTEIVVQGIPNGFIDKKGYRQNYIHILSIDGLEVNEKSINERLEYDSDGTMIWNGKRCEKKVATKKEQEEMKKMLDEINGGVL